MHNTIHPHAKTQAHHEAGAPQGLWAVYFHGAPGAPDECRAFDAAAKACGVRLLCLDRFAIDPSIGGDVYFEFLADEIAGITHGEPVDFIGFSIGAFVALQTSRFMRTPVQRIHLISAAAPLESGDYLPRMAGKSVFQLAQASPMGFSLLSHLQGLLARLRPTLLVRMLFANAAGADKVLANELAFQTFVANDLRSCFSSGISGYMRDVIAYVRPWSATLAEIAAETCIWHGAQDNWSPPAMVCALASKIRGRSTVEIMKGLSHYSCLYKCAAPICERLATTRSAKSLQAEGSCQAAHPEHKS